VDREIAFETPRRTPLDKSTWSRDLMMSSPVVKRINKTTGNVEHSYLSIQVVEEPMKHDGFDNYVLKPGKPPSLKQQIIYFLYAIEYEWETEKVANETEGDRQYRREMIRDFYKKSGPRKKKKKNSILKLPTKE
jgi:hypothetical protein